MSAVLPYKGRGMLGRGAKWLGWKEGGWSVEMMYAALRIQKTALSAFIGGINIAKRNRRRVRRALLCIALPWSCRRGLCTDIFQNELAGIYILARKTSVFSTAF
jgi:hypothetical protein